MWEFWVKCYLGQNEDFHPGNNTSDSSEKLLQRSSGASEVKSKSLSRVQLFVTPWVVRGILQARILEWVAFPFSRGSSQGRDWTQVSHITSWATREAQPLYS